MPVDELLVLDVHTQQRPAPLVVNFLRGLRKEACRAFARNGQQLICCTLLRWQLLHSTVLA
jgi:hypothetical protein